MFKKSPIISSVLRKLKKGTQNLSSLFKGYNIYVNPDKLNLINLAFRKYYPEATSFADLGGVWKVNAAYSRYTMKKFQIKRGVLVDTTIPEPLAQTLQRYQNLQLLWGDFGHPSVIDAIGSVDVILLFDVLLHQANPDWDQIIEHYANKCSCFIIYNQQYIRGEQSVRLTDLPIDEYKEIASDHAEELTQYVYEHKNEIHPEYGKPWKDIHNITQWGITDNSLRKLMNRLGFKEVFYKNYGMFINLSAFEEHAFIFIKDHSCPTEILD